MKKNLFLITVLFPIALAFGQFITSQNFTNLPAGDVGNDTTGAIAGQGAYYLIKGTAADYQIGTIDATHGKSLLILAGPGYVATNDPNNHMVMHQENMPASAGNTIIKAKYSLYTGAATGAGSIYFTLFDKSATPTPIVSLVYNVANKTIMAAGTVNNGTRAFAGIKVLGTTYPANTWVSLGMTYDMTTGAMTWYTPQESYSFSTPPAGYSLVPGLDIGQYRTYNVNAAGNTAAYNWAVDDIQLSYDNNTVLRTNDVTKAKPNTCEIYPNPATDYVSIRSDSPISSISVSDMSGKNVPVSITNRTVDVRSLLSGNYLISIRTNIGTIIKPFIKK